MKRAIVTPLWLILFCLGCAGHRQMHTRAAITTVHIAREAGLTDTQKQQVANLCFMGMPTKRATDLGPTEYIYRDGYVLEHSSVDKIPFWVCEHVKSTQLGSDTERSNQFKTDDALKGPRSTPADYSGTGYDRGHQAPAGNQGKDQRLQNETFFMSNMSPQLPQLNRNSWKSLEELSRTWVTKYSEAYEFTGPIFYDPKEDNSATADGTLTYYTIGAGVAVPTHFYKIIIVKDGGAWKAIAFVMPNVATYKPPFHLEQYIQSVSWVEDHTGLNFMPDLTAAQRAQLKSSKSDMWP
jgi:endonuclease G